MELIINGESKTIANETISVAEILKLFNLEMPDMVSVQLNGTFVERKNFLSTTVKDGDEIDFLYFMGGGR